MFVLIVYSESVPKFICIIYFDFEISCRIHPGVCVCVNTVFSITECVGMRERERDVTFFQVQAAVSIAADLLTYW